MSNKSDNRLEELIRIYLSADSQIAALILRAQQSGKLREAKYRSRVRAQVREMLAVLKGQSRPAVERAILAHYEDGQLLALPPGPKSIKGAFGGPHRVAINELGRVLTQRLDDSVATVGRSVNDVFRHETLRVATERLARGDTLKQGAATLEQALVRKGQTAFLDRAGRRWGLSDYAEMAIQTTTAQATTEGTKNRMLQQGYDLVFFPAHLHAKDPCSPYDGKTMSLTGATPGYAVVDKLPPWHPRCRHSMIAAKENFD